MIRKMKQVALQRHPNQLSVSRWRCWWFKMWTVETHLEEAGKVGVLDTVLGIVLESGQGFDQESGQGFDRESGQGSGLGWEFDQEWLQAPVLGSPQESDQDTAPGKFPVVRGPLGHDQVSGLHRFHLETGCKVSGTPLKCGHERKKNSVSPRFRHKNTFLTLPDPHLFQGWGTSLASIHQPSSVHCRSSTAFCSSAASFDWRSGRSAHWCSSTRYEHLRKDTKQRSVKRENHAGLNMARWAKWQGQKSQSYRVTSDFSFIWKTAGCFLYARAVPESHSLRNPACASMTNSHVPYIYDIWFHRQTF